MANLIHLIAADPTGLLGSGLLLVAALLALLLYSIPEAVREWKERGKHEQFLRERYAAKLARKLRA